MGRIAVINPRIAIEQSLRRFPESRDELLKAKELYEEAMRGRVAKISSSQNLSPEILNYPSVQIEPGVWTHRQWMTNKLNKKQSYLPGLPKGNFVDFMGTAKLPMGDWDLPDAIHHESSVSIQNVGDVYDSLQKYTTDNPGSMWQTYLTPGGVRAFEMSQQMTPRQFAGGMYPDSPSNRFKQLNIDENYGRLSVRSAPLTGNEIREALSGENLENLGANIMKPSQAFYARVSGKPGREGKDFVAYPLGIVGNARPNPYNQRIIREYHDIPIMKSMMQDGMTPGQLPPTGLDLLNYHLSSIPTQYREPIERKMERLGVY